MATYRKRITDQILIESLQNFGGILLEGPRAVGKTTTGLQLSNSNVRLDSDPQFADFAQLAPSSVLDGAPPRLVDEWQLAPALWNAARHEIDARQQPGQFIFSGSARPADDVTRHSGAGRFQRVVMRPMSLCESGDSIEAVRFSDLFEKEVRISPVLGGPSIEDYARLLVRGGWPALVENSMMNPTDYLLAYLENIARIDIAENGIRVRPSRLLALIRAIARNTASEVSVAKLATEAELGEAGSALAVSTARKYLDALEQVRVIEEQPAFLPHLRSKVRLRQQPKWHFVCPSVSAAALGASPEKLLADPNTFGFLFESLAIRDLRVYAATLRGEVSHYRDSSGLEVDAVVETLSGEWSAFEVKLGSDVGIQEGTANLLKLRDKVSPARQESLQTLNIITAGQKSYTTPEGVNVIALGHLTGF